MARDDHMIAALKRERAGYVARGDDDRVRQVDEQLRIHGGNPGPADETAGPEGRTAPPQQTADTGAPQQTGDADAKPPAKKTAAAKKTTAPPAK